MVGFEGTPAPPAPVNEPVLDYAPGSEERAALVVELEALRGCEPRPLPMTVDGAELHGAGAPVDVVEPHRTEHVLGTLREATAAEVQRAVDAALAAAPGWRSTSFRDRAAVFLRAADLLAGPWRARFCAATMLGQSKSVFQSEIDAVCELCDFLRFGVADAAELYERQPRVSPRGQWNQTDHRPLEGFVLAISPFNFTSIAVNLLFAPVLMGNTVVWKPSPTQQVAAQASMELLVAAGLPDGVVNLVTGQGAAVSEVALVHPSLAGIHFTGSTATFRHLWGTVAANLGRYRSFPRLVGETGGKDFVVAHRSADPDAVVTALLRGAFDYQGQKCSAASRAYLPASFATAGVLDRLADQAASLVYGDVADLSAFGGAVIDRRSFDRLKGVLQRLADDPTTEVIAGGTAQDKVGYFVDPTVVVGTDPGAEAFTTEFFGPILSVHVYDDARFDDVLALVDATSPYALTGAVFATDRGAIAQATETLRYAAGNFYVNDKPTGAVVGQQPFGGARASGTNDKAGTVANLERWVSPRTIKETFVPPTDHRYPHMSRDDG
ncbi:MAG TPA: L-glutamate gamma-semialdehyde dehydrogenase [Acidimicrobiales bacterium]|nr:L-glutamate gamma-semialdehyde dehydrogenase [Acidimicrobiales bacterium]